MGKEAVEARALQAQRVERKISVDNCRERENGPAFGIDAPVGCVVDRVDGDGADGLSTGDSRIRDRALERNVIEEMNAQRLLIRACDFRRSRIPLQCGGCGSKASRRSFTGTVISAHKDLHSAVGLKSPAACTQFDIQLGRIVELRGGVTTTFCTVMIPASQRFNDC